MKVLIIGAGPAGLSAGLALAQQGVSVEILESGATPGGMCQSIALWGQIVDLGPHRFFSKDAQVLNFWHQAAGSNKVIIKRETSILYAGKKFSYPLKARNVFLNLGSWEALRCGLSYLLQIFKSDKKNNLQEWLEKRFGRRLYKIFFEAYSEKLWGLPCSQIDIDFAKQRIRSFSLLEALKAWLINTKNHRTIVDNFLYPKYGTGQIYQTVAEEIKKLDGEINYLTPVTGLKIDDNFKITAVDTIDKSFTDFDHVISSMPLTNLVSYFPDIPAEVLNANSELKFRNTILVYFLVDQQKLFPDQWIYVQDRQFTIGRISNFANWSPEMSQDSTQTIICCELWCNSEEVSWTHPDNLIIEQTKAELQALQLIPIDLILESKVIRVPNCYPIYRCGYQTPIQTIASFLKPVSNLNVIGRYGSFKYNNQDHSILMGIKAAEKLLSNAKIDLWQINSDQDEYQEKGSWDENLN